ncbi:hypothetical protein [Bacillus pinisoli]|uniref:hypothetical protein n=1 Tax=Bacillus pinisoli TaxID=2901866 RepID=UPI001FF34451|nr:hypothetical protein [Bacillus pinisoli]
MTSESDDLKLQRLTDISFSLEYQKKWADKRTKDHNTLMLTNNNKNTVTKSDELSAITNNLRNLYLELDIVQELTLASSNGVRLLETIDTNLRYLEDSLLAKLSVLNPDGLTLQNPIGINESLIYKHHFLEMLLQNLKEIQVHEVGHEYELILNDIRGLEEMQKILKAGVTYE